VLEITWAHWIGKQVVDCVGLIKAAIWFETGILTYNGNTDYSADEMLSRASEKGTFGSMPDIPGLLLHLPGHVGIYVGNGQVIEAHGTEYGVILTKLHGGTPWQSWSKCPLIQYTLSNPVVVAAPAPTGNAVVKDLQLALNLGGFTDENGHILLVDGFMGDHTRAAMAKVALGPGSVNIVVGFVQTRLHVQADNHYGNPFVAPHYHETYDALGAWQIAKRIDHDFIIGKQTLNSLL